MSCKNYDLIWRFRFLLTILIQQVLSSNLIFGCIKLIILKILGGQIRALGEGDIPVLTPTPPGLCEYCGNIKCVNKVAI